MSHWPVSLTNWLLTGLTATAQAVRDLIRGAIEGDHQRDQAKGLLRLQIFHTFITTMSANWLSG